MLAEHFGAKRYVVYYLSVCGGLICLGHASMLVMPALFAKSKRIVHRLPLGCCSPCQYLLGSSNPWAWILLPPYHCVRASMRSLHMLIALLNILAWYLVLWVRVHLVPTVCLALLWLGSAVFWCSLKWLVTVTPSSPETSGQIYGAFWALLCNSVQTITHKVMGKPYEKLYPRIVSMLFVELKVASPTRGGVKFLGM